VKGMGVGSLVQIPLIAKLVFRYLAQPKNKMKTMASITMKEQKQWSLEICITLLT
jgi:hypothetical protein